MANHMLEHLGIAVTEEKEGYVELTMPVDERTRQPFGYLHGGASVVLAETAASMGSYALVDQERELCFGIEISANHLRSKQSGTVTAKASLMMRGRTIHVWDIQIVDEENRLICVSRCSVAVKEKR